MQNILIGTVAFLHFYFFILESILWTRPLGLKVFRMKPEQAAATKVLAANQGVYNLFLVAGLIWSLLATDLVFSHHLKSFFLSCIVIAGIVGAATVNKKIFFIQALPAIIALVLQFDLL